MQLEIFTDGGSRGNPGPAACAFIVYDPQKQEVIFEGTDALGIATNNEAEYQGFIASLKWLLAQDMSDTTVTWKLDSLLVVQQLNRVWKVKDARMQEFAQTAQTLLKKSPYRYAIVHVPREQNKRADALLNKTLDSLS